VVLRDQVINLAAFNEPIRFRDTLRVEVVRVRVRQSGLVSYGELAQINLRSLANSGGRNHVVRKWLADSGRRRGGWIVDRDQLAIRAERFRVVALALQRRWRCKRRLRAAGGSAGRADAAHGTVEVCKEE
jgi:hypothetical protein